MLLPRFLIPVKKIPPVKFLIPPSLTAIWKFLRSLVLKSSRKVSQQFWSISRQRIQEWVFWQIWFRSKWCTGIIKIITTKTILCIHKRLLLPLMKHLKQEGIGCTATFRANVLWDCPLPSKAMFKKEKKGCYKRYNDEESGIILAMKNDNGPESVGSNFEAIEPLGTTKRWPKEDKGYIGVPRPALIGFYKSQWVEMVKWIKQFLPANHLSAISSAIGHFSCIAWRYLCTIHGYYTSSSRKTVPSLNMHNQLQST